MAPTLATAQDMTQFPSLPAAKVTGALVAASALVRSYTRSGKPDGWVNVDGSLQEVPDEVKQATMFIARRVALMPDSGATQESAGPFAVTRDNGMWLGATEKMLLARWAAPSIQVMTVHGPTNYSDDYWLVPVADGGDLIEFPD